MKLTAHLFVFAVLVCCSPAMADQNQASFWQKFWLPKGSKSTPVTRANGTTRTPLINGRPIWQPVSNTSGSIGQTMANGTKKAASTVADVVTLKPLRDKVSASSQPKYSSSHAEKKNKGLSSLFARKPPERKGPKTISEWMSMERPKF